VKIISKVTCNVLSGTSNPTQLKSVRLLFYLVQFVHMLVVFLHVLKALVLLVVVMLRFVNSGGESGCSWVARNTVYKVTCNSLSGLLNSTLAYHTILKTSSTMCSDFVIHRQVLFLVTIPLPCYLLANCFSAGDTRSTNLYQKQVS